MIEDRKVPHVLFFGAPSCERDQNCGTFYPGLEVPPRLLAISSRRFLASSFRRVFNIVVCSLSSRLASLLRFHIKPSRFSAFLGVKLSRLLAFSSARLLGAVPYLFNHRKYPLIPLLFVPGASGVLNSLLWTFWPHQIVFSPLECLLFYLTCLTVSTTKTTVNPFKS